MVDKIAVHVPYYNLLDYKPYKKDDDASPNYYGFERGDGAWYIMRETLIPGDDSYGYVAGNGDVVAAWVSRVSQTYGLFSDMF